MNIVSQCCRASIVAGIEREYPLGGRSWYTTYKVDVCEKCGREADPVHTCEWCGTVLDGDNPEISGGGRCYKCYEGGVGDA